MKRYLKNQILSRSILLFTAFTLLINTTILTEPVPTEEPQKWYQKAFGVAKGALSSEKLVDTLKTLSNKSKATIQSSVSKTYEKIKNFDKRILFNKLIDSIGKLGTQMMEIKDCMLFGYECSMAKRAAFYATAITVLALTAAIVGFTITVAATSKEPDKELSQAVDQTSKEVVGWSAEAIFQRLKNKLASFKGNLISMEECLIKRQCTKKQKHLLYATAATIVVLVSIAIGIGVGSYIYAQRKKAKQLTMDIEEDVLREKIDSVTATEEEKAEAKAKLIKLLTMGEFDDNPASPDATSGFQSRVRRFITPIKGAQTKLLEAYELIKEEVKSGVIKSRKAAGEAFAKIMEPIQNFKEIIANATTANLATSFEDLIKLRNSFSDFNQILSKIWLGESGQTVVNVADMAIWGNYVMKRLSDAQEAYKGYSKEQESIINEKIKTANETLADEDATTEEKNEAQNELENARKEKSELAKLKLSPKEVLEAKVKKRGDFKVAHEKLNVREQKMKTELAQINKQLAQIRTEKDLKDLAEGPLLKKEYSKKENKLFKRRKRLMKKIALVPQERETLTREEIVDYGFNYKFIQSLYPTTARMINQLNLKPLGILANELFAAFGGALGLFSELSRTPGLGRVIAPQKVRSSMQQIASGIKSFGGYTQDIINVHPLITNTNLSLSGIISAIIASVVHPKNIWLSTQKVLEMLSRNSAALGIAIREGVKSAAEKSLETEDISPRKQKYAEKATAWGESSVMKDIKNQFAEFRTNLDNFNADAIKKVFIAKIKEAPIKNIPRSPQILVDAIADTVEPLKISFRKLVSLVSEHLKNGINSIPLVLTFFTDTNHFFAQITGQPFINLEVERALFGMVGSIKNMYSGFEGFLDGITDKKGRTQKTKASPAA